MRQRRGGELKTNFFFFLKANISSNAVFQLGLLEPKPHVAKMREAAKQLAESAEKAKAEKLPEVVVRK